MYMRGFGGQHAFKPEPAINPSYHFHVSQKWDYFSNFTSKNVSLVPDMSHYPPTPLSARESRTGEREGNPHHWRRL
jgi:hypothetical protein